MTRDQILARLRHYEHDLRRQGVVRAALFGSVARGEAGPDSDIDILVELDPDAPIDLFAYVGIVQFIEELFPLSVDVANRAGLKALVRPRVEGEASMPSDEATLVHIRDNVAAARQFVDGMPFEAFRADRDQTGSPDRVKMLVNTRS